MAKSSDQQLAQCVSIRTFKKRDKEGNVIKDDDGCEVVQEIYQMELEGKEFELLLYL